MNIIILIDLKHFEFFGAKFEKSLKIDVILSCNPFTKRTNLPNIKILKGFMNWYYFLKKNKDKNINLIAFDYDPLPIYVAFKIANILVPHCKKNFIQHGIFEDRAKTEIFPIKTIEWFAMTSYFIIIFFLLKRHIFKNIYILREYASKGAASGVELLIDYPQIDNCFYWDDASKAKFIKMGNSIARFKNHYIVGSPDNVSFSYKPNDIVIYISQPLYKTGHCNKQDYIKFINTIENKCNSESKTLIVILHPKIAKNELAASCTMKYLDEFTDKIDAETIFGHFSSLLLKVPKSIPIIQFDLDNPEIKDANKKFIENYFAYSENGENRFFNNIKRIILSN